MVMEFDCLVVVQVVHELQFRDNQLVKMGLLRRCIDAIISKKFEMKRELITIVHYQVNQQKNVLLAQ